MENGMKTEEIVILGRLGIVGIGVLIYFAVNAKGKSQTSTGSEIFSPTTETAPFGTVEKVEFVGSSSGEFGKQQTQQQKENKAVEEGVKCRPTYF